MPGKNPTVSVIIPTYNRAHLISRAIKSVLNQTYQDFEVIVVDDGSTDNTEEVIKEFQKKDERIKYVRHEKNKGGSAARNTGIKAAKGKYIAFLDSDDEWLSKKLQKQIAIYQKSEKLDSKVLYTGIFYIDQSNGTTQQKIPTKEGWIFYDLLFDNVVVGGCSTVILPRRCIDVVGLFDEMLDSSQDLDMWLRLSRRYPFIAIKEPLTKVYIHEKRITENARAKVRAREHIFEKFSEEIQKERRAHGYFHFKTGNICCHNGYMKEGRDEFLKAIKIDPWSLKYYPYFISSCLGFNVFQKLAWLKNKVNITKG